MSEIKVAALQLNYRDTFKETINNLRRHVRHVMKDKAPQLIVLPELWVTGFNKQKVDEYFKFNHEKDTIRALKRLSKTYDISIIGSIPHSHDENNKFNAIPLISNGKINGWYHKLAIFPKLEEGKKLGFKSGMDNEYDECSNQTIINIPIDDGYSIPAGVTICGELRYPEQFYAYITHGCKLLINCSQWRGRKVYAWAPDSHFEHWDRLLKSRAIESQCYVLGVNRIGREGKYEYEGATMLIDPNGEWVKPKVDIIPNSKYGEKIKFYKIKIIDRPVSGGATIEQRHDLASFWFWKSTTNTLWNTLTYSGEKLKELETFIPFINEKPQKVDKKLCFVAIPSKDDTRLNNIKRAINSVIVNFGFKKCIIIKNELDIEIAKSIFTQIQKSSLVIADITEQNPNVLYEVGLANALRKPIIFITEDDPASAPFDIHHFRLLSFKRTQTLVKGLTKRLREFQRLKTNNNIPKTA